MSSFGFGFSFGFTFTFTFTLTFTFIHRAMLPLSCHRNKQTRSAGGGVAGLGGATAEPPNRRGRRGGLTAPGELKECDKQMGGDQRRAATIR